MIRVLHCCHVIVMQQAEQTLMKCHVIALGTTGTTSTFYETEKNRKIERNERNRKTRKEKASTSNTYVQQYAAPSRAWTVPKSSRYVCTRHEANTQGATHPYSEAATSASRRRVRVGDGTALRRVESNQTNRAKRPCTLTSTAVSTSP